MTALLKELEENGLICRADAGGARSHQLTSTGCDVLTRLIDARRAHLADLIAEWPTEQREEVAEHLRRISRTLVPDIDRERLKQSITAQKARHWSCTSMNQSGGPEFSHSGSP
jgi:hypothetical protein